MDRQITENETTQKRRRKFNWIPVIVLLVIIYGVSQAYLVSINSIDTIKATEGYINDSIISQGIVCREEVVLTRSSGGIIDYLIEDGERISKNTLIANVYATESDVENMNIIRQKKNALENIETVVGYTTGGTFDVSVTKKQLSNQLTDMSYMTSAGNYSDVYSNLNSLSFSLNKIGFATGREVGFSDAKNYVQAEIDGIAATVGGIQDSLYAPYTGYFISVVDGYEDIATANNFINMSYEEGSKIINSSSYGTKNSSQYGKIITDYKWSVCTYVDKADAEKLKEGGNISVSINITGNEFQKATISNLIDFGDKVLVVVQCSYMDKLSRRERICDCELLFKQYNGIKIPKTALHVITNDDGEKEMGVYVVYSNVVKFKKISPLFEDENYVVVPVSGSADNQVKLYDTIIVSGRDLYDGKYL